MGLIRGAGSIAVIAVVVLAGPSRAAAQDSGGGGWATRSATLDVRVTESGSAEVRLDYVFVAREGGAALPLSESIPVNFLGFGAATVREVIVDGSPLVLWPTTGSHRQAAVRPPAAVDGDAVEIALAYTINEAVEVEGNELTLRVPLVTGPPPEEGGDGFVAAVRVPAGWAMAEGFPSGLRPNDAGVWEVSLPVVPSVVRMRGRSDGARRVGLPLVVDVLTLSLLLAFAFFGWRHLRGVVRAARS